MNRAAEINGVLTSNENLNKTIQLTSDWKYDCDIGKEHAFVKFSNLCIIWGQVEWKAIVWQ